jgi:S1-C subfamily serine protease
VRGLYLVDACGYIVTNAHVVSGARSIDVTLLKHGPGGSEIITHHAAARLIGMDRETDLAARGNNRQNM